MHKYSWVFFNDAFQLYLSINFEIDPYIKIIVETQS